MEKNISSHQSIKYTRIYINYRQSEAIAAALKDMDIVHHEIVVVDNSPDDTAQHEESARVLRSKAQHLALDANKGFGTGANRGARASTTPWLLFLNSDVHVTEAALDHMVSEAEHRGLDAACPETSDPRYSMPLPSWWWFLNTFTPFKRLGLSDKRKSDGPLTLWGGCLLMKRTVFESLGGFDERFFLWFEDSDLTRRCIDAGYSIGRIAVPGLTHEGGVSFAAIDEKTRRKWFFTSAVLYADKHLSPLTRCLVRCIAWRFSR